MEDTVITRFRDNADFKCLQIHRLTRPQHFTSEEKTDEEGHKDGKTKIS